jgi:hypothetical protein
MSGDRDGRVERRAILAAGAGSLVAAVAAALGRPLAVAAHDGDPVKIGQVNDGSSTTVVHTSGPEGFRGQGDLADGLVGQSAGANKSGVFGFNTDPGGFGIYGVNNTSGNWGSLGRPLEGVKGFSKDSVGVLGQSAGAAGVRGQSNKGDGVVGQANYEHSTGVRGITTDKGGFGVWGDNTPAGTIGYLAGPAYGVYGDADGAGSLAVFGIQRSPDGVAVEGWNQHGSTVGSLGGEAGVYAEGQTNGSLALNVHGHARFDRSGVVTVPNGAISAIATTIRGGAPLKLLGGSMVLATLQTRRAGLYVQAAVPDPAKGRITIYLNKKAPGAVNVAWLVLDDAAH